MRPPGTTAGGSLGQHTHSRLSSLPAIFIFKNIHLTGVCRDETIRMLHTGAGGLRVSFIHPSTSGRRHPPDVGNMGKARFHDSHLHPRGNRLLLPSPTHNAAAPVRYCRLLGKRSGGGMQLFSRLSINIPGFFYSHLFLK